MENPGGGVGNRIEAERLLSIAENLLQTRDLAGSREFAVLAQETEPLLDGSDQILSICDVLLAGDKRVGKQNDWYAILQVDRRSTDLDLIKRNYRRLALLLHPDKNKYSLSNSAFRLVADAWAVLSDRSKKSAFDAELSQFSRVELTPIPIPIPRPSSQQQQSDKLAVRRTARSTNPVQKEPASPNFWTACPYCYVLYEYPRVYEECCLRCQSCDRAFHAAVVSSLPPLVPGKEAYYCCWGFFPLGFSMDKEAPAAAFPDWMPSKAPTAAMPDAIPQDPIPPPPPPPTTTTTNTNTTVNVAAAMPVSGQKRRGRPRKNPL